ncbi:MAG: YkgJ family cysteine cluster protein [Pseudobdellovibrionaceae bacterium]
MKTDKDKPWTWVKYRDGLCKGCYGSCCTMPVEIKAEDLVRLELASEDELSASPKKVAKRLIKEGILASYRESTGNFMLTQKSNDDCYYLDLHTRLCKVYDKRPGVCRKFPEIGPKPGFCPARKHS